MNLSQFEQLKKEKKLYIIGPNGFSLRLSFRRKNSLKNPDSEFKTGETI